MSFENIKKIWFWAFLWLLFLGPFFFISYGLSNHFTAAQDGVGSFVFLWEKHIPFLPWTIVPYWSLDILYGLSLFVCTSKRELNIHALRLFLASVLCCVGFLLFPLKFSFVPPLEIYGIFGEMFRALKLFDLPYNQAPSLHIALGWIVWLRLIEHSSRFWRVVANVWFLLIGVSTLTTWQHHFIDIPTGLLVGVLVSYLLPINNKWQKWKCENKKQAIKLAVFYALAALLCLLISWWLVWPAISFAAVSLGYLCFGTCVFQKNNFGRVSASSLVLLAPYRLFAWLSHLYFTAKLPAVSQITANVFLGSFPHHKPEQQFLLDMTAEFYSSVPVACCPRMDLIAPTADELQEAVEVLMALEKQGSVLVFCALGLSRSALVVAAWLVASKKADNAHDAVEKIKLHRGQIILHKAHIESLMKWIDKYCKT